MVAGLHVPLTPLVDVAGKAGAVLFWHSGPIAVNVGVSSGSTVMLNVVAVAHCPASGVKVYVVVPAVPVLIVAGFQVPLMPLVDVAGNAGAPEFWHNGPIGANVGTTALLMVMSIVVTAPHCPAVGVKV